MAVGTITPGAGALPATPSAVKQTVSDAFLDLRNLGWAQQYLPELMEQEAEVFGNRTLSGFLSQVGAEEAMALIKLFGLSKDVYTFLQQVVS